CRVPGCWSPPPAAVPPEDRRTTDSARCETSSYRAESQAPTDGGVTSLARRRSGPGRRQRRASPSGHRRTGASAAAAPPSPAAPTHPTRHPRELPTDIARFYSISATESSRWRPGAAGEAAPRPTYECKVAAWRAAEERADD